MALPTIYRAELNYQDEITADEITVIFNGTTYTVPKENGLYGLEALIDSSAATGDYPFCIARESDTNYVYVNADVYHNHNPFTIKIVAESVTTTPCFDKARGYGCEEETVTLTEESVTTTMDGDTAYGTLSYSQLIDADSIKVTFDGVEYECPRTYNGGRYSYGASYDSNLDAYDWSEYPFTIDSFSNSSNVYNELTTQAAGTYSVKIEVVESSVTTTSCFQKAVASIAPSPLVVEASCAPSEGTNNAPSILDASPSEIQDAMRTRGVVVEDPYGNLYSVLYATDEEVTIISSQYDQTATPPTVLEPYMYGYQDGALRYPQKTKN